MHAQQTKSERKIKEDVKSKRKKERQKERRNGFFSTAHLTDLCVLCPHTII